MPSAGKPGRQAAARPEGNAGRAWIRTSFPEGDGSKGMPRGRITSLQGTGATPAPRRPRAVYVRELEGGGCLVINEDGTHREAPKLSPPEGDGWEPLHDERGLPDDALAQNRWSSKQNRKIKAEVRISKEIDSLADPLSEGHPMEGGKDVEGEGREGAIVAGPELDPLALPPSEQPTGDA